MAWDDRFRFSRQTLETQSALIAHRGPDGEGLWLSHAELVRPDRPQVGLVHRRLAIIDPDPRANQPFPDGDGRWVVFNGEIYNFLELRSDLTRLRPDYAWKTRCDTEVLLLAFSVWGLDCCRRLNGMFAFAVWDSRAGELSLARDGMGQKPLYVAMAPPGGPSIAPFAPGPAAAVAFASELPALMKLPWVDAALSAESLSHYLQWGCVGADSSIYRGAFSLAPGTTLTVKAGAAVKFDRYFSADVGAEPGVDPAPQVGDAAAVARTRELVRRAVERQLVSDVPLGCFLSGGVDSSVIAAAMRAARPGSEVRTFSVGFDDPRYDETGYAAAVARHLGVRHESLKVTPRAAEDLPRLAAVFGEPFGDSSALPTHYLSRATREHVKVALSGDGGDELFGGYDRYRAARLACRLRRAFGPLPWPLVASVLGRGAGAHPKSAAARAARFARSLTLPAERRYLGYLRLFDDELISELLPESPSRGGDDPLVAKFAGLARRRGTVPAALAIDRLTYLPGDLLTKVDRCSMLHALEVRSPFMDHEVVGFAASLTTRQLLGGGPKRLLREAFAPDLPAWVFSRKKMGFALPIGDWLRTTLRPLLHDALFAADSFAARHFNRATVHRLVHEHEQSQVDHSQRLYALLMLELWEEKAERRTKN